MTPTRPKTPRPPRDSSDSGSHARQTDARDATRPEGGGSDDRRLDGGSDRTGGNRGRRLARRVQVGVTVTTAVTNLLGATAVFVFIAWVLPEEPFDDEGRIILVNGVLVAVWAPLSVLVGTLWGLRTLRPARRWLIEERPPTEAEELAVLRGPLRLFRLQMALWLGSAAVFAIGNGMVEPTLIARVAFAVVLGGLTTSTITYLRAERLMRPIATRALAEGAGDRPRLPGVTVRHVVTWSLGTGVPVLGLVITGIFGLADADATRTSLAVTMIALGATALLVGLWTTLLAAWAVGDPIRSVRRGLSRVAEGDFDAVIPVYDGSEVGLLQDGFNRMTAGLRERERIRDLFGRQVGADVAADALDNDNRLGKVQLGGEVRDVAVLFADIVGSTRLATEIPPSEVVEVLNRFFAVVVGTVDDHGGWINKFQGDAALAVFGAPGARADPAGSALAAARSLARRLADEAPDCEAGIGVAFGTAVAGNIGAEERFEYTVIGDPINAASRLTELAKDTPGRVLTSGATVAAADATEAHRWERAGEVTLRGRTEPTELHRPKI